LITGIDLGTAFIARRFRARRRILTLLPRGPAEFPACWEEPASYEKRHEISMAPWHGGLPRQSFLNYLSKVVFLHPLQENSP
jgi:hypothetical protein